MADAFDDHHSFNYNRLHYLEKLVNDLYFGAYQNYIGKDREQSSERVPVAKRGRFLFLYERNGIIGRIEIERLSETIWETSEIGKWGTYDCTHHYFPSWLLKYTFMDKPRVSSLTYEKPYGEKSSSAFVRICGLETNLTLKRRRHENGIVYSITFEFQNISDSDQFSRALQEKIKDNAYAEEKLRNGNAEK